MSDSNVQPMEQRPQTPRPQNVGLPHTTHGTSTLNRLAPMSSPWNEDPKLSDSHVQPMEQRLQTIQLSCPTHGMKASNHPTLMSNPWNEGFKLSNSHVQPMELPTPPNDDRHNDAKHDLLAIKVLTSSRVSAMKSDGEWINNAHYLSCI